MGRKILILQRGAWRDWGRFMDKIASQSSMAVHVLSGSSAELPDFSCFDAMIILGSPVSARGEYSCCEMEREVLDTWLRLDRPLLGFGSGCRLLAESLGALVGPCGMATAGFVEGFLTHDGREHPIFQGIASTIGLFKWYNQSMLTPLPPHCILLATSTACVVEAFALRGRPHIVGMQCDNHAAHPDDLRKWMACDYNWFREFSLEKLSDRALLNEAKESLDRNERLFERVIANFLSFTE